MNGLFKGLLLAGLGNKLSGVVVVLGINSLASRVQNNYGRNGIKRHWKRLKEVIICRQLQLMLTIDGMKPWLVTATMSDKSPFQLEMSFMRGLRDGLTSDDDNFEGDDLAIGEEVSDADLLVSDGLKGDIYKVV